MLSFLVQEGVLTIGTVSGIFTALLLNSAKNNVIDPLVEKVAPIDSLLNRSDQEILEDIKDDGKLNGSNVKTPQGQKQSNPFGMNGTQYGNQFGGYGKNKIRWKIFTRDLITWLIIMCLLYLAWKHIVQPIKNKNGLSTPTTNTQFFPMGIGKVKKP